MIVFALVTRACTIKYRYPNARPKRRRRRRIPNDGREDTRRPKVLCTPSARSARDAGVWNGHSYEDVPATTIKMKNPTPNAVRPSSVQATDTLIAHMYRVSPTASNSNATCSITGRLSMNISNGHFLIPFRFRCLSPQRSEIEPPTSLKYLFNHCLPNIAMKAAKRVITRLAYRRFVARTISWAGPDHALGGGGRSPITAELLRERRMARRYTIVISPGSGCRFVWISMTNDELTAENKPA